MKEEETEVSTDVDNPTTTGGTDATNEDEVEKTDSEAAKKKRDALASAKSKLKVAMMGLRAANRLQLFSSEQPSKGMMMESINSLDI